ncbi:MAG: hypothetical protein KDD60_05850, partial [Bdellovibrionales bacterium]|nr:hypothetical protein [Bdellovibrionales bacterium]
MQRFLYVLSLFSISVMSVKATAEDLPSYECPDGIRGKREAYVCAAFDIVSENSQLLDTREAEYLRLEQQIKEARCRSSRQCGALFDSIEVAMEEIYEQFQTIVNECRKSVPRRRRALDANGQCALKEALPYCRKVLKTAKRLNRQGPIKKRMRMTVNLVKTMRNSLQGRSLDLESEIARNFYGCNDFEVFDLGDYFLTIYLGKNPEEVSTVGFSINNSGELFSTNRDMESFLDTGEMPHQLFKVSARKRSAEEVQTGEFECTVSSNINERGEALLFCSKGVPSGDNTFDYVADGKRFEQLPIRKDGESYSSGLNNLGEFGALLLDEEGNEYLAKLTTTGLITPIAFPDSLIDGLQSYEE